jgi:hypothetical protein
MEYCPTNVFFWPISAYGEDSEGRQPSNAQPIPV